MNAKVDF